MIVKTKLMQVVNFAYARTVSRGRNFYIDSLLNSRLDSTCLTTGIILMELINSRFTHLLFGYY